MNFLKRAFYSVTKKKGRSILLAAALLIITNLVLTGIAIKSAAQKSTEFARRQLGSEVTLAPDINKVMSKTQRSGEGGFQLKLDPLTEDIANKVKDLEHVKAYNYTASLMANASGFKPVEVKNDSSNQDNKNGTVKIIGKPGGGGKVPDVSVTGALFTELLGEFANSTSKLVQGRHLGEEDKNKKTMMIEKRLAEENSIKLGDKLKLDSAQGKSTEEFEVVGIYETKASPGQVMGDLPFLSPYNKIYTSYNQAALLKQAEGQEASTIDSAVYYIDDPMNIEKFKEDAWEVGIDKEKYSLDANDDSYKKMIGPIENVASYANKLMIIVASAGAVILALILMLSIKERNYEIGVLVSMGEKKEKIVGQFIAEMFIITAVALSISMFTGNAIAGRISSEMVKKEVAMAEKLQEQNPAGKMMVFRIGGAAAPSGKDVKSIDKLNINITAGDFGKLSAISLIIAVIAVLLPCVEIFRFSPKTILARND